MLKRRLLLADDSVTIQKVVNLTFADEGIEVVAVGDGDAAMQKFVESVPDLVMVDVNMPGADGYRICEMIKQDEETMHIPVILLVGSFEPFDEEEARRVGADDFLTKPFQSIRQLVNKVTDLLNGKTNSVAASEVAPIVSSFRDTLDMPVPSAEASAPVEVISQKTIFETPLYEEQVSEEFAATTDFGDAAMDDELIQTSQINGPTNDEAQKSEFVSADAAVNESDFESPMEFSPDQETTGAPMINGADADEDEKLEDEAETPGNEDESLPSHENIYDFATEQDSAKSYEEDFVGENVSEKVEENSVSVRTEDVVIGEEEDSNHAPVFGEAVTEELTTENVERQFAEEVRDEITATPVSTFKEEPPASPEIAPALSLDDVNLLELPNAKKLKPLVPLFIEPSETVAEQTMPAGNFSPELIEAISDRVVEKISDRVIEKIVRETVAQITEKK